MFPGKRAMKRILLRLGYSVRRVPRDITIGAEPFKEVQHDGLLGSDPFKDMRRLTAKANPLVFDVGANLGQTVQKFCGYFEKPQIHAFEPGDEAFQNLTKNTQGLSNVRAVNCGMGARREEKTFVENTYPDMSSFLEPGDDSWGVVIQRRTLALNTIDDYCARTGIAEIDILKSDTQGYDLEVLRGASRMLKERRIGLIYIELTFAKMYLGAPRFDEVYGFLTDNGMALVSFYEMHYQNDALGWTDALFKRAS